MDRAASLSLLSFLALSLCCLSGCGSEFPEPSSSGSTATTSDERAVDISEQTSTTTDKATEHKGPTALPLNGVPKLLLSDEELRDGWIQLFDGQTLSGWTPNNDVDWHVTDDGVIEASQGEPGLLLTTVPFADFELRCEYWVAEDGNSGIFLRCVPEPTNPTKDCYEFNIFDSRDQFGTGSLVGRAEPSAKSLGEERWRTCTIKVEGNHFTASLDGDAVLDFKDDTENFRANGRIGLQKNAGLVKFRNVFVKPLSTASIFNGKDLSGWHAVAGSKSEFKVADEAISVSNGPGFLESNNAWSDFVLQFEAKTNGDGLNSGVFFRLIPGSEETPSNGYELQIENVFANDDRTQPKDNAGTGAIFRRTRARWVVPNDHEWFTMTLIAHGPRIAAWVNGFQVTDWEDNRSADPNPRRGSKIEAGPISLQGHDPTTNLSFRNLRVAEYPAAN
ncbi:MAG: DUF1080 domain-containing protein [Planctomycetota bacterium]|nr:DUF1080 domain-containing protein [Planctomycetota bacterium]